MSLEINFMASPTCVCRLQTHKIYSSLVQIPFHPPFHKNIRFGLRLLKCTNSYPQVPEGGGMEGKRGRIGTGGQRGSWIPHSFLPVREKTSLWGSQCVFLCSNFSDSFYTPSTLLPFFSTNPPFLFSLQPRKSIIFYNNYIYLVSLFLI